MANEDQPEFDGRVLTLSAVFSQSNLVKAWKATVRQGLRNQAQPDLHDYLDVHRGIRAVAARISDDIVHGAYRPREPEIVLLEKRYGITRRVLIPSPQDALVLQTLVDQLEPLVKARKPSENAYYSRSHQPPTIDSVDGTFAYPWALLWPEFQDRIWQFSQAHEFVVSTDVANFFDTVSLRQLRNSIASLGHVEEAVLDFLFYVLESFVWRPLYAPGAGAGLPQINFDAPRLLAYAFLFEADEFLERETKGSFVRWMDDINFGTSTEDQAKRLLGSLQRSLNSIGLRLNASKTRILSSKQADDYFFVRENRALTVLRNTYRTVASDRKRCIAGEVTRRYRRFRRVARQGNWDKVLKRFLALFVEMNESDADTHVPEYLANLPSVRDAIFRAYRRQGYNSRRYKQLEEFLVNGHCRDDVSKLAAARLIVDWTIPKRSRYKCRPVSLAKSLLQASEQSNSNILAGLLLMAKYGSQETLNQFVSESRYRWMRSDWLSRQVAALLPLLDPDQRGVVLDQLRANGLRDGLSVLHHLAELRQRTELDRQLREYFFTTQHRYGYPLHKVILAVHMLQSDSCLEDKESFAASVKRRVGDWRYERRLEEVHAR